MKGKKAPAEPVTSEGGGDEAADQAEQSVLSIGRNLTAVPDISDAIAAVHEAGLHFVVIPLVHPRVERRAVGGGTVSAGRQFTRSDMTLGGHEWSRYVVGAVSDWVVANLEVPSLAGDAARVMAQELSWAQHLSLSAVQIGLRSLNVAMVANCLNQSLSNHGSTMYWIRVPITAPALSPNPSDEESEGAAVSEPLEGPAADPWEWWVRLRQLCVPTVRLAVALELTADLPSGGEVLRWLAEPIKAVIVPKSIFLVNAAGFPVLPKAHQAVVKRLLKYNPQFVIKGSYATGNEGDEPYQRYLRYLYTKRPSLGPIETFGAGYEDVLQCPLQPLMDNLDSTTYEVFEQDPIKYARYEEAVQLALLDRVPADKAKQTVTVIMVVGAGRGPLVQCCLQAAKTAGRKVKMFAIEKNPNAVVTLEARNAEQWEGRVTVVATDMRKWRPDVQADIMVSELLGSFGDNELSPECLDGAQAFLAPDGISIPASSTSFLAPLSAPKLHIELVNARDSKQLETPYVVLLHAAFRIAEPLPAFHFVHPNHDTSSPDGGPDNERIGTFEFKTSQAAMMHGFAGYFESVLYGDVIISTNPATHSPGMFSWFPIFFPLKVPMYVPPGATITIHIWRKASSTKVWYEWACTSPSPSAIHNVGGGAYHIGL